MLSVILKNNLGFGGFLVTFFYYFIQCERVGHIFQFQTLFIEQWFWS